LFRNGMWFRIPSGSLQLRHDVLAAGVRFGRVAGDSLNGRVHGVQRLAAASSFSSSRLWRSTSSTSNAETEPRPPDRRDLSRATRRKSSQVSEGRLIPVVRCVRSSGFDAVVRACVFNILKEQVYWKMLPIVNCRVGSARPESISVDLPIHLQWCDELFHGENILPK
jgi:hypothetical protein